MFVFARVSVFETCRDRSALRIIVVVDHLFKKKKCYYRLIELLCLFYDQFELGCTCAATTSKKLNRA